MHRRGLALIFVGFLAVCVVVVVALTWGGSPPPPLPTPDVRNNNEKEAAYRRRAPLESLTTPTTRVAWEAPDFAVNITEACGYDRVMMIQPDGNDVLYMRTQIAPVFYHSSSSVVYEVGRWRTDGSMLLVQDGRPLPFTRCGDPNAPWDRVCCAVTAEDLLIAHVASVPSSNRAFFVWPAQTIISPLVDDTERPSALTYTAATRTYVLYSWSAMKREAYLRESRDAGLSWTSPPMLIQRNALRPLVLEETRPGTRFLMTTTPASGDLKFAPNTLGTWSLSVPPHRVFPLVRHFPQEDDTLVDTTVLPPIFGLVRVNATSRVAFARREWTWRSAHVMYERGRLHVLDTDTRFSRHTVLVSERTCQPDDVYVGCVPLDEVPSMPPCRPKPQTLGTACVRYLTPLAAAFHAVSLNDGLTWDILESVGKNDDGSQTIVRAATLLPNGNVAVAYLLVRPGATLRVAELRVQIIGTDVDVLVDTLDLHTQAWTMGGVGYDGDVLAMRADASIIELAYSATTRNVYLAAHDVPGGTVDITDRSRLTIVKIQVG